MADPGNRMSQALNVGSLVGQFSLADSINNQTDPLDFYRITLDRSSRFSFGVIKSGGSSPSVESILIRDFNNNDIIDSNESLERLTIFPSGREDSANEELPAGTYFISVGLGNNVRSAATDYTITMTNTPVGTLAVDPGNLMSQALDIGILNGRRTFSDYVGNSRLDAVDYYRFTLDRPTDVSVTLSDVRSGTSILLIQDRNNNDVVDRNETIARNSLGSVSGSPPVSINQTLQPGTYFVEINSLNNAGTNYTVSFFTPGATTVPFGPNGPFFNLSTDADNFTIDPARVGNLLVQGLDGNDVIQGSPSADRINGNAGDDNIVGGDGNDTLWGGRDSDRIDGNAGNDLISGNLGNDTLSGGAGDDILRGGQNNDVLIGGEGNDQLVGDLGRDILTGEGGNDLFVLRVNAAASSVSEADVITDFTAGQDAIGLTNGLTFAGISLDASGGNTAIRIVANGQILGVVSGIQPAALSAANFTTLNGDF